MRIFYVVPIIIVVFFISYSTESHGQCCSGGVPMAANVGLPSKEKGSLDFGVNYDWNVLNDFRTGTTSLHEKLRKRTTHSLMLQFNYSFSNRISLEAFIPWNRQERFIKSSNDLAYTQGIGDAVFLLKLRLAKLLSPSIFNIGLGSKLPTGASDKKNAQGFIEAADMQPGSGSLDGIFWASFVRPVSFRPSLNASLSATYKLNGKNNDYLSTATYHFGNEFQTVFGLTDRFLIKNLILDPSAALRFRVISQDKFSDNDIPNTGGKFIFLVSGITFLLTPKLSYGLSTEIPLYRNVTGIQVSPSYRINTRLFYTLNFKRNIESFVPLNN